jgi:hypothetical protein
LKKWASWPKAKPMLLGRHQRADEIGDMTRAVAVFRDAMIERERLEGESAKPQKSAAPASKKIDSLIAEFPDGC